MPRGDRAGADHAGRLGQQRVQAPPRGSISSSWSRQAKRKGWPAPIAVGGLVGNGAGIRPRHRPAVPLPPAHRPPPRAARSLPETRPGAEPCSRSSSQRASPSVSSPMQAARFRDEQPAGRAYEQARRVIRLRFNQLWPVVALGLVPPAPVLRALENVLARGGVRQSSCPLRSGRRWPSDRAR